ncbi:MAG: 4a-hydroxytetrahydrobiopterin dehydratase [Proteobacteria bacterium]|nr:4a-hydroxytetrahydrobiopterin dehydratase [Pseudomonadota bacterium]
MSDLCERSCAPCRGGLPALRGAELEALLGQLGGDWRLVAEHHLARDYTFADFRQALTFANAVGELAEQQGHHPELLVGWGKVGITIWTHKVDGLTESDFVLAAKIDQLPR